MATWWHGPLALQMTGKGNGVRKEEERGSTPLQLDGGGTSREVAPASLLLKQEEKSHAHKSQGALGQRQWCVVLERRLSF